MFASKLEMRFYRDWILPRLASGDIIDCQLQVEFQLQKGFSRGTRSVRAITYVADFVITDINHHIIVIDTKGAPDSTAIIKRKLFWFRYPDIDYRWIGYSRIDGGWIDYDVIKAGRSARKKTKTKSNK